MFEGYEEFSPEQVSLLERFVTNTDSNVFCLRNLPEVIKGALFSRYSRSTLGLRSLLLKDFILNEETAFTSISGVQDQAADDQMVAIKKAQNFYDRILDGYGDDSIGELGGAHLALENVSMLAAKTLENKRIGGSPLEKSARYVYFGEKVQGEYLFYREPVLMTSAYRDLYVETCNMLFSTYSEMIPPLTAWMEKEFPQEDGVSNVAYKAALRAKVLDCLRGLLPASTLTNLGIFGNGRFFETLIKELNCNNLAEIQDLSKKSFEELSKVIPSFIRRSHSSHPNQESFVAFSEVLQAELKLLAERPMKTMTSREEQGPKVSLVDHDPDGIYKVAAALLYPHTDRSLQQLEDYVRKLSQDELAKILDAAAVHRENRRHKSPRALERAEFTFEILTDYGAYRDLQRHRTLTQDKQLLSCNYGFTLPSEIKEVGLEREYIAAMEQAKKAYDTIAEELPEEAQYVVPIGYHYRWYFHLNLRAAQWLCELRSGAAGHTNYRLVAQEMAKQISTVCPQFASFFKFVDYEGYQLGRLGQEVRKEEKMKARS